MSWTVLLSPIAEKTLLRLSSKDRQIVIRAIDRLLVDPLQGNVKPLLGAEWAGRFRKRAGNYRIIFQIKLAQSIVEVSEILRRSEKTYRG